VNPNTATLLFLFSVTALIISVFSFFYFKSYLRSRTIQERILSDLQEEVNLILKSINEITVRDITLIEEREKELKRLLEEIDKCMKTYLREMDSARKAEEAYQELGKNRYRVNRHPVPQAAKVEKKVETLKAPEAITAYPLPDFVLMKETNTSPASPVSAPSVGEQIRSMLRSGFSEAAIASRLGISIAEVEFASALASSATKSATSEN
jgi:hypothetical protein